MFRKLLFLAFGVGLAFGGTHSATAGSLTKRAPVIGVDVTLVGHRHHRGHVSRGYHRGYRYAPRRYRGRGHYSPRYGYGRGYGRAYRGRSPGYGRHRIYRSGPRYYIHRNYGHQYGR